MNERVQLMARLERLQPLLRKRLEGQEPEVGLLGPLAAVTLHQMSALRHLADHGPLTMNELALRMGVGPSSATQLVDRLAHQGLVERAADPKDRRVQRVVVTEKATVAVQAFKAGRRRQLTALLDPLTDEELETFVSLAERMVSLVSHPAAATQA